MTESRAQRCSCRSCEYRRRLADLEAENVRLKTQYGRIEQSHIQVVDECDKLRAENARLREALMAVQDAFDHTQVVNLAHAALATPPTKEKPSE